MLGFVRAISSTWQQHLFESIFPINVLYWEVDDPEIENLLDRTEVLIGGTLLDLVLSIVLAIVAFVGAIGLLKLRPWGRMIVIALTWLSLVSTVIGIQYL